MSVVIVTGSTGLIGSEAVDFFSKKFATIVGIDNNMRKEFFGDEASTKWNKLRIQNEIDNYIHYDVDIRDKNMMDEIFKEYNRDIGLIIHAAAQPSHDWAAKDPFMDFSINANGTMVMLESFRNYSPDAVFIFTSTNKVYGDSPNSLPLIELNTRWEISECHPFYKEGIDESMSIDQTKHSIFGASKVSADILVQEYGKYFGLKTGVFRGGCLTGSNHSGTKLHGFLSYIMKCILTEGEYTINGYKGKQVRDNIHSYDFINMLWSFYNDPRPGEVYNAGGSRHSNCSVLEAIQMSENVSGKKLSVNYSEKNRIGDHIWWISDVSKFKLHYPEWDYKYGFENIIEEIFSGQKKKKNRKGYF